jgi:RNA polymerase sigma-70 factor (ECF subfamily)
MSRSRVSLAELIERHRPEIMAYLLRLLGDVDDAQDACQEAFLRAHRAFARLRPDSNARAWLYRIATNTGLNARRGRARRVAQTVAVDVDALPAYGNPAVEREELRAVARAAVALPPKQRAALMLRQFQGLGYAEIAASLGVGEAAARANVYQAVRKLRAALGPQRPEVT